MMISFWHLAAVCCVPNLNFERREREVEIFREAAHDCSRRALEIPHPHVRGRWEVREPETHLAAKS